MSNEVTRVLPRRWNVELDGVRWLPRMIDKARMQQSGRLGAYLLGHSPVDAALLDRLHVTTHEFDALVRASGSDEDVLTALRTRWDEPRVRRWSDRFPRRYHTYIHLWDIDEGYARPNSLEAFALRVFRPIEATAMAFVRRIRRAP